MKTTCIIKTKRGAYATRAEYLGLAESWTKDKNLAARIEKSVADKIMVGLNGLIPGHASLAEILTEA